MGTFNGCNGSMEVDVTPANAVVEEAVNRIRIMGLEERPQLPPGLVKEVLGYLQAAKDDGPYEVLFDGKVGAWQGRFWVGLVLPDEVFRKICKGYTLERFRGDLSRVEDFRACLERRFDRVESWTTPFEDIAFTILGKIVVICSPRAKPIPIRGEEGLRALEIEKTQKAKEGGKIGLLSLDAFPASVS